jgi:hypothetical protein
MIRRATLWRIGGRPFLAGILAVPGLVRLVLLLFFLLTPNASAPLTSLVDDGEEVLTAEVDDLCMKDFTLPDVGEGVEVVPRVEAVVLGGGEDAMDEADSEDSRVLHEMDELLDDNIEDCTSREKTTEMAAASCPG